MPDTFVIKRGDTRPRFRVQLTADGTPVDLTGNQGVFFIMRSTGGSVVVNAAATVIDAATGIVEYPWILADTATAGDFEAEVEVAWGAGRTSLETYPSTGYFVVTINPDIA